MKWALLLSVAWPMLLHAQAAPVPLRLVRCAPGSDAPCLAATFRLDPRASYLAATLDSAAERKGWRGDLAGARLIGPGLRQPLAISPPLRLLVLVDRSPAMSGEAIAFTRSALRSFLGELDAAAVRAAVVGFAGREVALPIAAARFRSPPEAITALEQLPSPEQTGGRALYSAVTSAAARLTAEVKGEPGTTGLLIVVTDGPNAIDRRRDDAGLLDGAAGIAATATALREAGVTTWAVAIDSDSTAVTLREAMGSEGVVLSVPPDPNLLAAHLTRLGRGLRAGRTLLFGLDADAAAGLARSSWSGTAALWVNGRAALAVPLAWQPPLFALPAFTGVADEAMLPPRIRDMLNGGSGVSPSALVAVFMLLVVLGAWYFVPHLVWIRGAQLGLNSGVARPASPTQQLAAQGKGIVGGAEVGEAAPRRPDEITQQTARRSAQRR